MNADKCMRMGCILRARAQVLGVAPRSGSQDTARTGDASGFYMPHCVAALPNQTWIPLLRGMSRCRTWRTTAPRPEATHVTSPDSSRPHAHLCPTLKASHAVATWRGRGGGCVRRKGRRRQPQRHGAPRMRLLRDDSWARDDRTQASRPTPAPPHVRGAGHTQQPRPRCGILATSAQLVQRKRKLRSTTKKAMHVQAGGGWQMENTMGVATATT